MKPTIEQLLKRKAVIKADLLMKFEVEDWHGVQDCGSDLREIDAQLKLLAESAAVGEQLVYTSVTP